MHRHYLFVCFVYFVYIDIVGINGQTSASEKSLFTSIKPKCDGHRTFCEYVENYPEEALYKILKTHIHSERQFTFLQTSTSIRHRLYGEKENFICTSAIKTYYPRAAYNINQEWKYVYNLDKYKQGITIEECVKDASCKSIRGAPGDVKTKCVQKYTDAMMLVADDDGHPVWDLFWFPSACVCSYEPLILFNKL